MTRLVTMEWTHPQLGDVQETVCARHERALLEAFITLGIGCGAQFAPADSGPCGRCGAEQRGVEPRIMLEQSHHATCGGTPGDSR